MITTRTFLYDAGRNTILQTDQKSNLIAPGMTLPSQIKTALSDLIPSVYDDDLYMDKRRRGRNAMGWDCFTKPTRRSSCRLRQALDIVILYLYNVYNISITGT